MVLFKKINEILVEILLFKNKTSINIYWYFQFLFGNKVFFIFLLLKA